MVLLRGPLGRRGSYAPTALNVVQNAAGGALVLDLASYASFLFLARLVLRAALRGLLAHRAAGADACAGVRWSGLAAFAFYQWLQPTGPAWWTHLVGEAPGLPIGASLPSFTVAFALDGVLRARRRVSLRVA